jgi:hypothetical protein
VVLFLTISRGTREGELRPVLATSDPRTIKAALAAIARITTAAAKGGRAA